MMHAELLHTRISKNKTVPSLCCTGVCICGAACKHNHTRAQSPSHRSKRFLMTGWMIRVVMEMAGYTYGKFKYTIGYITRLASE